MCSSPLFLFLFLRHALCASPSAESSRAVFCCLFPFALSLPSHIQPIHGRRETLKGALPHCLPSFPFLFSSFLSPLP
ncbi:MAG: hypothetical protein BYD32DRAFT_413663 [Podila humilis]|nr:MAG: hypothetical protein BYD32DRAFT_413663 [Podila humilis]